MAKKKKLNKRYYQSKHWRSVKQRYYKNHKYECSRCGKTSGLHLHHITYKRLGKELDEDLKYLCAGCHWKEHRKRVKDKRHRVGKAEKKYGRKEWKRNPLRTFQVFR